MQFTLPEDNTEPNLVLPARSLNSEIQGCMRAELKTSGSSASSCSFSESSRLWERAVVRELRVGPLGVVAPGLWGKDPIETETDPRNLYARGPPEVRLLN